MGYSKQILVVVLLFLSVFVLNACKDSSTSGINKSLEFIRSVEPIQGAQNVTIDLKDGHDQGAYFEVDLSGIESNPYISNGTKQAWCIEWDVPANRGNQEGVKLHSTQGKELWREVNYFLSQKDQLQEEFPGLGWKESQIIIWSLVKHKEFDIDNIPNYQGFDNDFYSDGEYLFDVELTKEIIARINGSNQKLVEDSFAVIVENDGQTVIVDGERIPSEIVFPGETGELVQILINGNPTTVEKIGEYYVWQGDIAFPIDAFNQKLKTKSGYLPAIGYVGDKWDDNTLPYIIEDVECAWYNELINNCFDDRIRDGIELITDQTSVIKIIERTTEEDYAKFISTEEEGSSWVEWIGKSPTESEHKIYISTNASSGTIAHEILHYLGFPHEQSRANRDDFVIINYENIIDSKEYNYDPLEEYQPEADYDTRSVMHYGSFNVHAIDIEIPIITDLDGNPIEANREELTENDIKKINDAYSNSRNNTLFVINDLDVFNDISIESTVGNRQLIGNLLDYNTKGIRNSKDIIWIDCGRNNEDSFEPCNESSIVADYTFEPFRTQIENSGYSINFINSSSGSITNIPSDVKAIFLWNPRVIYTVDEINIFKKFMSEGGRIIFVGEHQSFYGENGISTQNQFLSDMGTEMRNAAGSFECEQRTLPSSSIVNDEITADINSLGYGCFSNLDLGLEDKKVLLGQDQDYIFGALAKINTSPIEELTSIPSFNTKNKKFKTDSDPLVTPLGEFFKK